MTIPMRVAATALALLLANCTAAPEPTEVQVERDLCREIASVYLTAQRNSFTLDFTAAERDFRAIIALHEDRGDAPDCLDAASRSAALAELGLALSGQRKFRLAEEAFDAARDDLAARSAAAETLSDRLRVRLDEGRILTLAAQHALNRQDFSNARGRSARAIALLDSTPGAEKIDKDSLVALSSADRDRWLFGLSSYYARSAALSGTPDAAEAGNAQTAITSALQIARDLPGATGALGSRILSEQALVQLNSGQPAAAAVTARGAADQLEKELPDSPMSARARLIEAVALDRSDRRADAMAAFDRSFDAYAQSPVSLSYESVWPYLKLALESNRAGTMDDATMAAGIFRAAQLVRTANAASDIAQAAALLEIGEGEAAVAVRSWRAARERLYNITSALSRRDLSPVEADALNRLFVVASDEERSLRARRDRVAPEYRAVTEAPLTLPELQAGLEPGEALLQILVGSPRSTLILVEPERVRVRTVRIDAAFATGVTQLLLQATNQQADGRYPGFATGVAHQVYQLLMGDLAEDVAAMPRLFVATNGALQGLPLELLVTQDPADQAEALARGDYSGVAWFGAGTEISYVPAPRSLLALRSVANRSQAPASLLGFGNYDPGQDAAAGITPRRRETCGNEVAVLRGLPRLPGTADELSQIGVALGGTVQTLTGAEFTEDAVKALSDNGGLRDYRILHFATHGLLWPTIDCFDPALTTSTAPGSTEDGLLESAEIRALDLDADLVVLSACQSTDVEVAEAGENLSGLARAFFTSGARAVIASHWLVDDVRTAALMSAFYSRLGQGPDTAFVTALRGAQASLRLDPATSHPAFWAPFVVLGDGTLTMGGA